MWPSEVSAGGRVKVAVAGGAGYVGGDLVRLLLGHPSVELAAVTSRSQVGEPVTGAFPHLSGLTSLRFGDQGPAELAEAVDVLFLALPHGSSMDAVASLFDAGGAPVGRARVVDMSGDFRLNDPALYKKHYKTEHACAGLLSKFTYGLTEWAGSRVAESRHVANPGCFATAIGLALSPLASAGLLPPQVTVFAATGSTGSGHTPARGTHHPERATNYKLYKVLEHQHVPEILGHLSALGATTDLSFIPASAPMTHGIFATCHMRCEDPSALEAAVWAAYGDPARTPFVRLRQGSPELNWVVGSNFADVGLIKGEGELVVACAIDNMIKGAAGQAIQNMNLMLGLDPRAGLTTPPSLP